MSNTTLKLFHFEDANEQNLKHKTSSAYRAHTVHKIKSVQLYLYIFSLLLFCICIVRNALVFFKDKVRNRIFFCYFLNVRCMQGDPANGMYFVESGTVTVLKKSSDGEEKNVRRSIISEFKFYECWIRPDQNWELGSGFVSGSVNCFVETIIVINMGEWRIFLLIVILKVFLNFVNDYFQVLIFWKNIPLVF